MKRLGPRREPVERFSLRLAQMRRGKRLTHETVARVCRVSVDVVKEWESGAMEPEDPAAVLEMLRDPPRGLLRRRTDLDEAWPARLRDLRVSKNLTQRAVADELGVSTAAVSQWEAGAIQPRPHRCAGVLELVGRMAVGERSARGRKPKGAGRDL